MQSSQSAQSFLNAAQRCATLYHNSTLGIAAHQLAQVLLLGGAMRSPVLAAPITSWIRAGPRATAQKAKEQRGRSDGEPAVACVRV
jgi:hypothetical protein